MIRTGIFCVILLFALSCTITAIAQEAKPKPAKPAEYTSVDEVAKDEALLRDFNIQGEYLGKEAGVDNGVNVIARGEGKFDVVVFLGGLPGAGWQRGDSRIFGNATIDHAGNLAVTLVETEQDGKRNNISSDIPATITAKVEDGKLSTDYDGTKYVFTKVLRQSPTEGEKAPEDTVVLFADGKMNEGKWESGKLNEEAKTLWAEAATKPFEKKPYKMHVEFLLSYMPEARGQARSNSGVYIDECYECQVLDSFGLEGKNNECAGFYTVAEPKVNMCFPPLRWQTYDIDFVPAAFDAEGKKVSKAKITVRHNGVLVHDGIEPEKETPGRKKEGPEARGLYLQGHGNKVQYRNIWLKY